MAYLPLENYKYDSGPRRLQSGPDHESYIVLSSGVQSFGADNGFIVDGTPLSGAYRADQTWAYDANWRYVPVAGYDQLDNHPYKTENNLDAYSYGNITQPITIAGVKATSAVTPDLTFANTVYKRNAYFGGRDLSDQYYSPFNTPESNSSTDGYTGGGVTRGVYENPLLVNIFGSQGTANRGEWNYSQPVYCKTFTETIRGTQPGQMSTPVRSAYRDISCNYSVNYGANVFGRGFVTEYPDVDSTYTPTVDTGLGEDRPTTFDTLTVTDAPPGSTITWFSDEFPVGTGPSYTPAGSDWGHEVYPVVNIRGLEYPGTPLLIYRPSVLYTTGCRYVRIQFQGYFDGYYIGYDRFPFASDCNSPNAENYYSNPPLYDISRINFCSMQWGLTDPNAQSSFPEGGPLELGPYGCGVVGRPCGGNTRGVSGYYKWWDNFGVVINIFSSSALWNVGGGGGGWPLGSCPVPYASTYIYYDMNFVNILDVATGLPLKYGVDYFLPRDYCYLPGFSPAVWDGALP